MSNYSNKYRFYYKGKDIKKNVYILLYMTFFDKEDVNGRYCRKNNRNARV